VTLVCEQRLQLGEREVPDVHSRDVLRTNGFECRSGSEHVAGRGLNDVDRDGTQPVAIVSEAAAQVLARTECHRPMPAVAGLGPAVPLA
jgi:hypothetical protein